MRRTALKHYKFYFVIIETYSGEGVNEQGAGLNNGLIPNDGAVLNDGAVPNEGDVIVDHPELMAHPDNIQVKAYGQLLINVQELKDVVGE